MSSLLQTCPACNTPILVAHEALNLVHCTNCFRVYHFAGTILADSGPCTIIFEHTEPIQVGCTGVWKKQPFTITGRCRLYLNESVFNYWTILFSDRSLGWLAEGYGLYFIIPDILNPANERAVLYHKMDGLKVGKKIAFPETPSTLIEQVQVSHKTDMEGQAFFPRVKYEFTVYELSNTNGAYQTAFAYPQEKTLFLYDMHPISFENLALKGLREGIASKKAFTCVDCRNSVRVKNYPYVQSCICASCGAGYYLEGTDFKKSGGKFVQLTISNIPIKIGTTGNFKGEAHTVIGYAEKQEHNIYKARWREYYLRQDENKYIVLSEYDGHWICLEEASNAPVLIDPHVSAFTYKGREFSKFNQYNYRLLNAGGEFPHNILDNDDTECFEYVCPPFIWIYERDRNDGIRWFYGEHLPATELSAAFELQFPLPEKKGMGAVSPTVAGGVSKGSLLLAAFIGLVFLLVLHMVIGFTKEKREIMSATIPFSDTSDMVTYTVDKFRLEKSSANLDIFINATVNNSWFELSGSLVNTDDGKEYSFEQGVEYYNGNDGGESWSEGSQSEHYHLTKIPAGNYILQLQGSREPRPFSPHISEFIVKVTYDVTEPGNLAWAAGLLLIWPVIIYLLIGYDHQRRWLNSPFYTTGDDDDN